MGTARSDSNSMGLNGVKTINVIYVHNETCHRWSLVTVLNSNVDFQTFYHPEIHTVNARNGEICITVNFGSVADTIFGDNNIVSVETFFNLIIVRLKVIFSQTIGVTASVTLQIF